MIRHAVERAGVAATEVGSVLTAATGGMGAAGLFEVA